MNRINARVRTTCNTLCTVRTYTCVYVVSKSFRAFSTEKKNRTLRKIKNYYLHRRLGRPRRPPCGFRGSAGRDNRVPSLVVQITRDLRLPRRALPTSTSSSLRTSVVQSLGSSPAMHTRTLAVSRDTRALMPPSPQRRPVAVVGIFSPPTLIHLFFISSRDSLGPDRRKKIPKPFFPPAHAKRVLRDTRAHSRRLRNGGRRRYIPPPRRRRHRL